MAAQRPQLCYFLINSRPAAFQLANPAIMAHQVPLKAGKFLKHDSVLDCSKVVGGVTASEIEDLHSDDPSIYLGRLETEIRRAVRHVVQHSELLSPKEIAAILSMW